MLPSVPSLVALLALAGPGMSAVHVKPRQAPPQPGQMPNETNTGELAQLWASITPSTSLDWVTCLSEEAAQAIAGPTNGTVNATDLLEVECARLTVPLDWTHSGLNGSNETATLAVSRIPATDKANYKGPLFINFGGPGASGNEKLVALSKVFREMAGAGYDLVTWDPRGTGSTLPALSCYKDVATRQLFQVERMSQKALNGNNTLSELVAANKWLAEGCELFSQKILPFMGTMSTVRDLAHLVDVYGHSKKLSYWGISYGTTLGGTFAALFPDRVERVLLDANLDLERYWYSKDLNYDDIQDGNAGFDDFFHLCHLAGPSECKLWRPSVEAIRDAYLEADTKLRASPITIPGLAVYDWSIYRQWAYSQLYSPLPGFSRLAAVAAEVLNGTAGEALTALLTTPIPPSTNLIDPDTGFSNPEMGENIDVILCSDFQPYDLPRLSEIQELIDDERAEKLGTCHAFGTYKLACGQLRPRKPEPFSVQLQNIKTSHPILMVNNLRDPITPLDAAYNTSSIFCGSVVLANNITGHGLMANVNECVGQYVHAYFNNGTLPATGTVCQPDILPLGLTPNGQSINATTETA